MIGAHVSERAEWPVSQTVNFGSGTDTHDSPSERTSPNVPELSQCSRRLSLPFGFGNPGTFGDVRSDLCLALRALFSSAGILVSAMPFSQRPNRSNELAGAKRALDHKHDEAPPEPFLGCHAR